MKFEKIEIPENEKRDINLKYYHLGASLIERYIILADHGRCIEMTLIVHPYNEHSYIYRTISRSRYSTSNNYKQKVTTEFLNAVDGAHDLIVREIISAISSRWP